MFKRTLCLLLALVSVIGLLPMTALAAEEDLPELFESSEATLNPKARASSSRPYEQYWYVNQVMEECESNNSLSKADPLQTDRYTSFGINGSINSKTDSKDFYKFKVTEWTYLVVMVCSGHPTKHSQFTLHDSDGDKLKTVPYKSKWGSGSSADTMYLLKYIIKPGTYYVRAYEPGKSGYSYVSSTYSLAVHLFPALKTPSVTASSDKASGKPVLKWGAIADADYYRVYRSTSKDGTYSTVASEVYGTTWTDTSAKPGKAYYYKVKAYTYDPYYSESGLKSNASSADKKTCKCARPDDISIGLSSKGKPRMEWDKVSGAEKYAIYRATSEDGDYKKIATTSKNAYADTTAKKGKTYHYKVKALSSVTSAADSAVAYAGSIKATK